MLRCLELAELGKGNVSPNPMVGSVIVSDDNHILGEGFHEQLGGNHAEINAINAVNLNNSSINLFTKSTLYVNLEPCSHYGKTPPCADTIIKNNFKRVVVGCKDSSQKVNGKGIEKIKNAGIEVIENIEEKSCTFLNRRFFTFSKKKRPYIILKWAVCENGFFAPIPLRQFSITSMLSQKIVHQWRSEEDSILVGTNTARIDNPRLNARLVSGKNPTRIVIDRFLNLPQQLHLFDQSQKTIVFNEKTTSLDNQIHYIQIDFNDYWIQNMLYQLYLLDIQSIIIEGGINILHQFIKEDLWDEARVLKGMIKIETGIKSPEINGNIIALKTIGDDMLTVFMNQHYVI